MMKTRVILCLGLAAAVVGGATAAQAAAPPLRLCADPANLPFSSNAPEAVSKGAPGLYVEIGQAVAEALGRPMEIFWSLSYFGKRNLRTTLLAGQCDFAVGLPATSDFMGPRVIFTRPILKMGYSLVVPKARTATRVDDLKGKRVAVQLASPPQSLLAARSDVTSVTTLDPEDAMRRLATGEVDAAFIWGPSASYINHSALHDKFDVIPVDAPQMQWQAAIGFSNKQSALRDEVDAALGGLEPRIRAIVSKYRVAMGPSLAFADAAPIKVAAAANEVVAAPAAPGAAEKGDPVAGKEVFNGTCGHCHGPDAIVADRKINLRRLKLKYGDQMSETFFTAVTEGRPAKGMPAWKDVFKRQDFVNILTYLNTVQEK
ncbi:c-type cytochrome [Rhodoferax ferrireducens]|uniref:c-type cytochrome n=1 Tax=Rhodoferax ferrireducens TaxID=192843 RepID=UPI000E0CD139|nr:transporter substrate-binding domain-containing protein [Rhodoferax ferrireducens]